MSDKIVPSEETQPPVRRVNLTTQQWVDAYTVHLESVAEATASARLRSIVVDACREARSRAISTGDAEDYRILAEQTRVLERSGVGRFDLQSYMMTKEYWKTVAHHLVSLGFNLDVDIDIEQVGVDRWRISQQGLDAHWECATPVMQVLCAFVSFVEHFSRFESPVAYVRRVLESQGITKETWPMHAARLAIRNPWEGEP